MERAQPKSSWRALAFMAGILVALMATAAKAADLPDKTARTDTPQTLDTRIGKLKFTHDFANGYPTKDTVEALYDERDFQRACQLYLWAIPAVSFAEWQHGQASFGAAMVLSRQC